MQLFRPMPDDDGHDVASVQSLIRKHEVIERDLAAVGTKLTELFGEAGRLVAHYAEHGQPITQRQVIVCTHLNLSCS